VVPQAVAEEDVKTGYTCFVEARLHTGQRVYSVSADLLAEVMPLYRYLLTCTMVEHVQIVCEDTGEVLRAADGHAVQQMGLPTAPLQLPRDAG
jgi:hypothetical protein